LESEDDPADQMTGDVHNAATDTHRADRDRPGQHLVVEAFRIRQAVIATGDGVMGQVEAAVGRAVEPLDRPADRGNDVVDTAATEEAAVDRLVMDGVDAHHAHHQADPGQHPSPPAIDGLTEHDAAGVQHGGLDEHRRRPPRAAFGELHPSAPLADLGGHGEQRQRAVLGDRLGEFCGHVLPA